MESKICTKCKIEKPLQEYYSHKFGKYGKNSKCKECAKKERRVHSLKSNEKYLNNSKRYREKCTPGVYFIKATNGTYVGQSQYVDIRVSTHNSNFNYLTPVDKVLSWELLEEVRDKRLRLQREAYWIKKLRPTLNTITCEFYEV